MRLLSTHGPRTLAVLSAALLGACSTDAIVHDDAPPCACSNPDDACQDETCVQPEPACTPTSGCSAPYLCDTDRGRCACDPTPQAWDQCAPLCDAQTACPTDLWCDTTTGLCTPPLQCLSDVVCDADDSCQDGQFFTSVVWDGNDGYFLGGSVGRSCRPGPRTIVSDCATSGDCGAGDCLVNGEGRGVCEEPGACAPDEFRFGTTAVTCYQHAPCRDDEDCPDTHKCRLLGIDSSGYCGRSI